jgi:hypothetical protein
MPLLLKSLETGFGDYFDWTVSMNVESPYMDPARVQRSLERDEMIPVASVYPASVNGAG